jgi:hypothetical protein
VVILVRPALHGMSFVSEAAQPEPELEPELEPEPEPDPELEPEPEPEPELEPEPEPG